jgi:hypothetical protein
MWREVVSSVVLSDHANRDEIVIFAPFETAPLFCFRRYNREA